MLSIRKNTLIGLSQSVTQCIFSHCLSFLQHLEAQASIIIHPGSRYLRLGRPSDSVPHTVLHAIARKRKKGLPVYSDPFVIPQAKLVRSYVIFSCEGKRPTPFKKEVALVFYILVSLICNLPISVYYSTTDVIYEYTIFLIVIPVFS